MRVIILAAGQGSRLRPITNNKPKCLVEVAGKPLLEHQIETLHNCKIKDINIIGGYCAEQLRRFNLPLYINESYAETNMVNTLFVAKDIMTGDSDLIISYGDIVYEPKVLTALQAVKAPITIAVDQNWKKYWAERLDDPLSDAETLKLTDDNLVVELGKKPKSYNEIQGQYIGLIKIQAEFVKNLFIAWRAMANDYVLNLKDYNKMYMTSFLQHLIDSGWEVRAALIDNGWAEIDTNVDLKVATKFWKPFSKKK
jgi:choline kinase